MPRQTALDLFGAYASVFRECGEEAVVGVVCTLDEWMQAQSAATLRLAAAHGEVIAEEAIP